MSYTPNSKEFYDFIKERYKDNPKMQAKIMQRAFDTGKSIQEAYKDIKREQQKNKKQPKLFNVSQTVY